MRKRTLARELAVKFLYQIEIIGDEKEIDKKIEEFLKSSTEDQQTSTFTDSLIKGSWKNREKI